MTQMNEMLPNLTISTWDNDEIRAINADKELFAAYRDDETCTWSVTYWPWDEERNEHGSHQYLGEYRNLVQILNAMNDGGYNFYELEDLR